MAGGALFDACSSAGGVAIKAGSLIAVLILRRPTTITAMISSLCGIFTPIRCGGAYWRLWCFCSWCHRYSPDYPGSVPIPLTVYCAKSQNWGITSPAQPQMRATRFSPIRVVFTSAGRRRTVDAQRYDYPANNTVSLGAVGTSAVSPGLRQIMHVPEGRWLQGMCNRLWRDFCLSIKKSQDIANAGTQITWS